MHRFRDGYSTTGKIIKETCWAIYETLNDDYLVVCIQTSPEKIVNIALHECGTIVFPFLHTPTMTEEWLSVSKGFEKTWYMPNCIGGVDGKHFRITRPPFFFFKFFFLHFWMFFLGRDYPILLWGYCIYSPSRLLVLSNYNSFPRYRFLITEFILLKTQRT